jgi:hypothetical protein
LFELVNGGPESVDLIQSRKNSDTLTSTSTRLFDFKKGEETKQTKQKKFPEWQSNKTTGFIFYDKLKSLLDIQRRKS